MFESNIIGLDTETTGLNPYKDKLLSLQLGTFDKQLVFAPSEIHKIIPILTDPNNTFVIHNALFDLEFLLPYVRIPNIYDSMLAERILTTGTFQKIGLDSCIKKYFDIELDKSVRMNLEELGIDHPEFQKYAKLDVKYLPQLREEQLKLIKEQDLQSCLTLENNFVKVLTYTQYCGIHLNIDKWRDKIVEDKKIVDNLIEELNQLVVKYKIPSHLTEYTLFGKRQIPLINWASPVAVISVFDKLGIDTTIFDFKEKKYKKSVSSKHLAKRKDEHEIISLFIKYQKASKLLNAYGLNYLKELQKYPDGRLRSKFKQILNTGRLASGSGKVNFQNIPSVPPKGKRSRTIYERECFEPEKGNVFVTADYSSQESRLLASVSKDSALLNFYQSGEADLHSYATKLVFSAKHPEMLSMTLQEIRNTFPVLRQIMKGFNFA